MSSNRLVSDQGSDPDTAPSLPLAGLKVLDAATLLAGPLAASLLGDLGAQVVKVEMPGKGDPLRGYPPLQNGVSLLHKVTNRNKRAITLNLRESEGQRIFRDLASRVDVVVTNFRPDRLVKWGIDYPSLAPLNEALVHLEVSAFGMTGTYTDRPGFARIAEAYTGLAHITGFADGDPVLSGYPIVDAMTGLFGSFSILAALRQREQRGVGALIDLALYEPLLRLMEDLMIAVPYGASRQRVGNINQYVAPNSLYKCSDDEYVVLPISTDNMFKRLATAIGREDLFLDYPSNVSRVKNRDLIDAAIDSFTQTAPANEVVTYLSEREIPVGEILTPTQLFNDPHLRARGGLTEVFDEELGENLVMQTPLPLGMGDVKFPGRPLGADTREVLRDELGFTTPQMNELEKAGVI